MGLPRPVAPFPGYYLKSAQLRQAHEQVSWVRIFLDMFNFVTQLSGASVVDTAYHPVFVNGEVWMRSLGLFLPCWAAATHLISRDKLAIIYVKISCGVFRIFYAKSGTDPKSINPKSGVPLVFGLWTIVAAMKLAAS